MKGRTLHDILHECLMWWTARFQHYFATVSSRIHVEFLSKRWEGKRERQIMPPLVLLIKFVLLLIIFQVSFFFNLLVGDFRWNFGRQIFFPLAMATKMVAAWTTELDWVEYNSGSNRASNFKIRRAQSTRPIWNYEHDFSLNCTTRGPITN